MNLEWLSNVIGKSFSSSSFYIQCWKHQSFDIHCTKMWSLAQANILWLHSSLLWYCDCFSYFIHICDSMWKRLNSILLNAIGCHVLSLVYMGFVWISTAANFSAQIVAAEANKLIVYWSSPSVVQLGAPTGLWQDNGLLWLCKYWVDTNVNDDIFKNKHWTEPVSSKYFIKKHFYFLNQWNEHFLRHHHVVDEKRNTAVMLNMPRETLELLPFLELIWQITHFTLWFQD